MTEASNNQTWFIGEFSDRLGAVLEAMAGVRPPIECKAGVPAPSPSPGELILNQTLKGLSGASILLRVDEPSWNSVGSTILKAAGLDEIDAETSKSTFLETIGQASGSVCQTLSAKLRKEITCESQVPLETLPPNISWVELTIAIEGSPAIVYLGIAPSLLESIAAAARPPEPSVAMSAAPKAPSTEGGTSRTLDLLFDVELPVSVSFGRAQLPLKDVIKLTTGSIVELNRALTEPVEIIVNNCVIARGDVVVVEGNFGVRIQQVISRQERLRTLT